MKHSQKTKLVTLLGLLMAFVVLLLNVASVRGKEGSDALTVWVFDIGQGDAIFIDGPERQVLVDGGPDHTILQKLASVMWPWDRYIDAVIVTHPHADHLVGLLPVLERYGVGQVFDSGQGYNTTDYFAFENLAQDGVTLEKGDVIDLGGGATLRTIWPESSYDGKILDDPNDGSVVLLLEYGETTMLLTGDAGVAEEQSWSLPHVDVLKVGHHGSRTSTSEELLSEITPDDAIVSVAADNDYGLPDEDVFERLSRHHVTIYRTDVHGDVRVSSHGGEPEISLFSL